MDDCFYCTIKRKSDSKLASNLHKLNVPATSSNRKTINKLVTLAKEMEGSGY